MKEVEDKIKKARGIAQQIEQALSNGDWEQVAPDSPRLHEEVGTAGFLWPQVRGEHRTGHSPRYPLLCHANTPVLLHRDAYPR